MGQDKWDNLWERRPFPDSILWDVAEAAALVVTMWVFWEIAVRGQHTGWDDRYGSGRE